jgi:hypothetical protein
MDRLQFYIQSQIKCFSFFSILFFFQYEPVFESPTNIPYLSQMLLYECQGSTAELEIMSRENGRSCTDIDNQLMTCNAIVGAWARGSEVIFFV